MGKQNKALQIVAFPDKDFEKELMREKSAAKKMELQMIKKNFYRAVFENAATQGFQQSTTNYKRTAAKRGSFMATRPKNEVYQPQVGGNGLNAQQGMPMGGNMNMGGMPPPNPMNGVQAPPSNKRNKRPPPHQQQQQQFQQNKPPPNPMNNNRPPPNPKEKKGGKNSKFSGLMNKFENKGQIMGSQQRPSNNQKKQKRPPPNPGQNKQSKQHNNNMQQRGPPQNPMQQNGQQGPPRNPMQNGMNGGPPPNALHMMAMQGSNMNMGGPMGMPPPNPMN